MSAQSNLKSLGSAVVALCFGLAGAISAPAMADEMAYMSAKDTPNNNCYEFPGCRGVMV